MNKQKLFIGYMDEIKHIMPLMTEDFSFEIYIFSEYEKGLFDQWICLFTIIQKLRASRYLLSHGDKLDMNIHKRITKDIGKIVNLFNKDFVPSFMT